MNKISQRTLPFKVQIHYKLLILEKYYHTPMILLMYICGCTQSMADVDIVDLLVQVSYLHSFPKKTVDTVIFNITEN